MTPKPSRRALLTATGVAGAAAALPAGANAAPPLATHESAPWLQAVLERYTGFGGKASGGAGDGSCGAWLEGELKALGYACTRHSFDVPYFESTKTTLISGAATAQVTPQAVVTPTGPEGVTGPLRRADVPGDLTGAIALVILPYKRWAAIADPQVQRPTADAFRRGAKAAVLVTTGPTGEAIALNITPRKPGFDRPVAILAPKDAQPFLAAAAAGQTATLIVDGKGGAAARRKAFNLIARLDRSAAQTVIVSTPRSGWFGCTAERGSGLAVWLSLAHTLAASRHKLNVELLCTSGHEYEYLGGELFLEEKQAAPPASTKLWLHIGASVAARDWHELGPTLLPLPNADSQRVLTATADIVGRVKPCFKGVTGLEATYEATKATAGGELTNVLSAGYKTAIGEFGGHRYFHTRGDDLRCSSGELIQPAAVAFRRALMACLDA